MSKYRLSDNEVISIHDPRNPLITDRIKSANMNGEEVDYHDSLNVECRCNPRIYRGILIHNDLNLTKLGDIRLDENEIKALRKLLQKLKEDK